MATFRKRAGGWRVEVRMRGHYESSTWQTKAQAQAWAAELESQIRLGRYRKAAPGLVREALERYAREVSPEKRGRRWEIVRLARMGRESIAGVPLAEVRAADVAVWRDERLRAVTTGTVAREMNLLAAVFRIAVDEWHWLPETPMKGVKTPRKPPPRDRRISAAELSKMLTALGYDDVDPVVDGGAQTGLALLIALETAMRAGEITGLTDDTVHLAKRYVQLPETKNGDARQVPLSAEAVRLLRRAPGHGSGGRLFSISAGTLSTTFRRARIAAGIEDLVFHDSRHEAVTRLARKLDILDLARMVGRRDLASLRIYYNPTATEIAERLD